MVTGLAQTEQRATLLNRPIDACNTFLGNCENAVEILDSAYSRLCDPRPTPPTPVVVDKGSQISKTADTLESRLESLARRIDRLNAVLDNLAGRFNEAV
jgi:hypothetical protein